jgi:hypothetical protein
MTSCGLFGGCQRFGVKGYEQKQQQKTAMGCNFMLYHAIASTSTLEEIPVRSSETLATAQKTTRRHNPVLARHELARGVYRRDGRVAMRMRTVLLLNTIPVSQTQTHLKSSTCCVFVHVTSEFSFLSGALRIAK